MLEALIALLSTFGGLVASGLVLTRTFNERRPHLIAWSVTSVGLTVAFAAMGAGGLMGYSAPLFRVAEIGAALLAPTWLAVGVTVLTSRLVQVRFIAWLGAISFTVVATVILTLDPTTGKFTKSFPKPSDHYSFLPPILINGAHVVMVIALVVSAVLTAIRANQQDREAQGYLVPVGLVALAGVLVVAGAGGYLPGVVALLALAAAAGLVAYGAMQTAALAQPPPARDRASSGGYDDRRYDDRYDDRDRYDDQYAASYEQPYVQGPDQSQSQGQAEDPYAELYDDRGNGHRAEPPQEPLYAAPVPDGPAPGGRMYGQITVFTLLEGRAELFDRLAHEAIQAARAGEPELVVFSSHEVAGAPTQRIFYQLFRDQQAFQAHQRQPYVLRFLSDSRPHVAATNVIELALNSAKVTAVPPMMTDVHMSEFPR